MYSTVLLLFSIKSVYMDGEKMTINQECQWENDYLRSERNN